MKSHVRIERQKISNFPKCRETLKRQFPLGLLHLFSLTIVHLKKTKLYEFRRLVKYQ